MARSLSNSALRKQNQIFKDTGGVSEKNRPRGFIPAFYDSKSHQAHISRFANGAPAPIHVLDGLPEEWIMERDPSGRVMAVKASVIAGFIYHGRFYTREQAAQVISNSHFDGNPSGSGFRGRAIEALQHEIEQVFPTIEI